MSETIGEVKETRGELEIEWRIKNFFSLSAQAVYYFSSEFYFLGDSWRMQISPNGDDRNGTKGYVSLYIGRKQDNPPLSLAYSFTLRKTNGKEEKTKEHRAVFGKNDKMWGYRLILRSDLEKRIPDLLPNGVLTVICSLKHNDANAAAENEETIKMKDYASEASDLKCLLMSEYDGDVTFRVADKTFTAHRCILRARIPFFTSALTWKLAGNAASTITIDECDADVFRAFLSYAYTGTVENLSRENAFGIHEMAKKYHVHRLKELCIQYIKNAL